MDAENMYSPPKQGSLRRLAFYSTRLFLQIILCLHRNIWVKFTWRDFLPKSVFFFFSYSNMVHCRDPIFFVFGLDSPATARTCPVFDQNP